MKKTLLILITSILLLSNSFFVVSADDEESAFVPSIGYKSDIYVVDDKEGKGTVTNTEDHSIITRTEEDGCTVEIIITPYAKKDTIESDQSKEILTIAYKKILNATSVCSLAPVVSDVIAVSSSGLPSNLEDDDLVFSNIFDITTYVRSSDEHQAQYDHSRIYKVKVGAESLKNFVCLLHYNYETNEWELVKCEIVDEEYLLFTYPNASPFVIVAYVGDGVVKGKRSNGGGSSEDYKPVHTGVDGKASETSSHVCLFNIGGTCYCYVVGIIAVLSIFVNIYLIIRNKELKKYSRS